MGTLRILHLEDNQADAELVRLTLQRHLLTVNICHVDDRSGLESALASEAFDLLVADGCIPGLDAIKTLQLAQAADPDLPVIFFTGAVDPREAAAALQAGATEFLPKDDSWRLVLALRMLQKTMRLNGHAESLQRAHQLLSVVPLLSQARSTEQLISLVHRTARRITGADGAAFVLRDNDQCHYVDEDAIAPLFKGRKFPLGACITGWSMDRREPVSISDIDGDARIPHALYAGTFIRALAVVPIRRTDPIGAIAVYWAHPHQAPTEQIQLLQMLGDTTAVALENQQWISSMERRLRERALELEHMQIELDAFSHAVSHDMRSPLHAVRSFSRFLAERIKDDECTHYLSQIDQSTRRMEGLIVDLMQLSRSNRIDLHPSTVQLSQQCEDIAGHLQLQDPMRVVQWKIQPGLQARGDANLLRVALENLLSNAWKFSSRKPVAHIEFGFIPSHGGNGEFFVRDDGVGFDMADADHLFSPFQRLHASDGFPGTGIGLATVKRVIDRHGGHLRAEAVPEHGATFFFSLPLD